MFRQIIVFVVLAHGATPVLRAQTAGRLEAQARATIQGIWSTVFTVPDHPDWSVEDHFCAFGALALSFCPPAARERLRAWLADPANYNRPLSALRQEANQVRNQFLERIMTDGARERRARYDPAADPESRCDRPPGLITHLMTSLPVAIDVHDERVLFRYDGSNTVRTIEITDRGAPAGEPTLLGSSTARFEGAALIVESRNVAGSTTRFHTTTDGTRVVERYMTSDGGRRLELELTIDDPASFREPLVLLHSRIRTPDETILGPLPCEASQ